ncbi:uncharacterized protein [Diadema setosum]|uniref:uncharacterized protein n=1 Tax=Diadema antillarum TaxID=105358 RepID=UPI003A838BEA
MNPTTNVTILLLFVTVVILSHFQPSQCQIHHRFNCWRPGGRKRSDPDSSPAPLTNSRDQLQLKWSLQRYIDSVPASELLSLLGKLLQFENIRQTTGAVADRDGESDNEWISSPTDDKEDGRTWS